jgi:hypothetical protein
MEKIIEKMKEQEEQIKEMGEKIEKMKEQEEQIKEMGKKIETILIRLYNKEKLLKKNKNIHTYISV